jgi:glycerol-3-phosphate acyltransferase PlsY
MIKICLIALAAYLLGSVSSSVMLSSLLFRADVRKHGSGNAGATNVARNFGIKAGVATLLCDMLKALVAMGFGLWLGGELGKAVAGIACLLGHFFPVFFEFKGGKGISVGAVVDILWLVCLKSTGIYEIVPGFIAGLIAAVVVSLLSKGPGAEVEALFDKANAMTD